MNKKISISILIAALAFSIASCGSSTNGSENNKSAAEKTVPVTEAVTEPATEVVTEATTIETVTTIVTEDVVPEETAEASDNKLLDLDFVIIDGTAVFSMEKSDLQGITVAEMKELVDKYGDYNISLYFGNDRGIHILRGFYFGEYGELKLKDGALYDSYTMIEFEDSFVITDMKSFEETDIGDTFDIKYLK